MAIIDISSPISIIKLFELALAVVIIGLIGNLSYLIVDFNIPTSRFIDVGVYGYLMVNLIFGAAVIFKQEVSKNVRIGVAGIGSVLYLTVGALILEYFHNNLKFLNGEIENRIFCAGIFSLSLSVLYIAECFILFRS